MARFLFAAGVQHEVATRSAVAGDLPFVVMPFIEVSQYAIESEKGFTNGQQAVCTVFGVTVGEVDAADLDVPGKRGSVIPRISCGVAEVVRQVSDHVLAGARFLSFSCHRLSPS